MLHVGALQVLKAVRAYAQRSSREAERARKRVGGYTRGLTSEVKRALPVRRAALAVGCSSLAVQFWLSTLVVPLYLPRSA